MRAVSLIRDQNSLAINPIGLSEKIATLKADWLEQLQRYNYSGELGIRDTILKSICPDVYGLYPVKLAIALAICSGSEISGMNYDNLHHRGQSHVLLVGDPGLAKSKLLLSAVQIAPRAIHTTGMGCSSAGLTATVVKEDGTFDFLCNLVYVVEHEKCVCYVLKIVCKTQVNGHWRLAHWY